MLVATKCVHNKWYSKLFRIVRNVRILPNVTLIFREVLTNTRKDPILVNSFLIRSQARGQTVFNFSNFFYGRLCIY